MSVWPLSVWPLGGPRIFNDLLPTVIDFALYRGIPCRHLSISECSGLSSDHIPLLIYFSVAAYQVIAKTYSAASMGFFETWNCSLGQKRSYTSPRLDEDKAYYIWREGLFYKLMPLLPESLWKLVVSFLDNRMFAVDIRGHISGLRQIRAQLRRNWTK